MCPEREILSWRLLFASQSQSSICSQRRTSYWRSLVSGKAPELSAAYFAMMYWLMHYDVLLTWSVKVSVCVTAGDTAGGTSGSQTLCVCRRWTRNRKEPGGLLNNHCVCVHSATAMTRLPTVRERHISRFRPNKYLNQPDVISFTRSWRLCTEPTQTWRWNLFGVTSTPKLWQQTSCLDTCTLQPESGRMVSFSDHLKQSLKSTAWWREMILCHYFIIMSFFNVHSFNLNPGPPVNLSNISHYINKIKNSHSNACFCCLNWEEKYINKKWKRWLSAPSVKSHRHQFW